MNSRHYRLHSLLSLTLILILSGLAFWGSARLATDYDWTRAGNHTLSDASRAALGQITGAVHITAYARDQATLRQAIIDYIARYQRVKPDITLTFVNPDSVPDEVRERGIQINGELVFEYQGRTEHVRAADETTFMNALLRLSRSRDRWVVTLAGHGERDITGAANHDLGDWGRQLDQRGYRVRTLNLADTGTIPYNTAVLILAGPRLPLLATEVAGIVDYLEGGGNLLWLADPGDSVAGLSDYLGVDIGTGTLIDPGGNMIGITDPTITLITARLYHPHEILRNFTLTTLFPAAAVLGHRTDSDWSASVLMESATHTWEETGPLNGEIAFDADTEKQGPHILGMALVHPQTGARAAVIGDGDFLSNTYLANAGNLELGTRLIDWLGHEEGLITIPPGTVSDASLDLSGPLPGVIALTLIILLPALFMSRGIWLWWRRRQR